MIPDTRNKASSAETIVIDILSGKPRLSMKELNEYFQKKYRSGMSVQWLYKIVKHLVEQQILVKEGGLLSIDASWIHNLINFTDRLKRTYLENDASVANILLNEGENKSFQFEKVIDMDNFWTHALVTVIHYYQEQKHPDKNVYNYNHHSWFQLVRTSNEQTLGEAYQQMSMHWHLVSGSKTFLDTLVASLIETENFHYAQIDKGSLVKPNYYVVVIGDFIFETALPNYIHERMEQIYQNVKNISEFNAQEILMLINQPGKTTLTISRNKKRALTIREEIKKAFNEDQRGRTDNNKN